MGIGAPLRYLLRAVKEDGGPPTRDSVVTTAVTVISRGCGRLAPSCL